MESTLWWASCHMDEAVLPLATLESMLVSPATIHGSDLILRMDGVGIILAPLRPLVPRPLAPRPLAPRPLPPRPLPPRRLQAMAVI